ncbi:hypothetical protein ACOSQ3_016375 [Xanthoceras sorbifolium]
MESIYGENIFILDRLRGLRTFQIHIDVEAPGELSVTAKLNSSGDLKTRSEDSDEFIDWILLRCPNFAPHYNDERCHENFPETCINVASVSVSMQGPTLSDCHASTYSDMHVAERTISKLHCPNTKCGCIILPSLLKRLLDREEYGCWESLMLQKTLESMSDVVCCSRCETPIASLVFAHFAGKDRRRHVGEECMTPELKLQILQERQNSSQLKHGEKQRVHDLINEILSVKEILRDAKQCPSLLSYRCNKAIDGYDHFRFVGNNNHIFCWACQVHYFTCAERLRGAFRAQGLQAAHSGIIMNGGTN